MAIPLPPMAEPPTPLPTFANLQGTLSTAFARAFRDGQALVSTDYVLWALAPFLSLDGAFGGPFSLRRDLRRLLVAGTPETTIVPADAATSCLVLDERLAPSGLAFAARAMLREAVWRGQRRLVGRTLPNALWQIRCPWPLHVRISTGVHSAVLRAGMHAALDHADPGPGDLLVGLLTGPGNRAQDMLTSLGYDPKAVLAHLGDRTLPKNERLFARFQPTSHIAQFLKYAGQLDCSPRWTRRLAAVAPLLPTLRLVAHDPLIFIVEQEAICQAARLGHPQVTTGHLLLALASVDHELTATGHRLRATLARHDHAGAVLRNHQISYPDVARRADRLADADIPSVLRQPHQWWRWRPPDPPFGEDAAAAVRITRDIAARLGHRPVSTGHLLAGALEHPGGSTHELLDQLQVDALAVLDETRRWLAH